jgi:eukaryotic-like serine/threonine-protein kinase
VLASGVLIDERHEIEQLLGRGGMGEVFRARDLTTGQSVAIKLLRMVDPQSMGRFRTEIEVLGRLDHPGVVRLCGMGSHDGVPYLVLELVDGPSLAHVLADGPLGVEQSISIGQQLAEALMHAHGLDIVHRDVKPANVICDADPPRVRLADFGIALFSDTTRMTAAGACIGTAAYLAPEQLEGQVGPAADVYALGLVVLECLTGTRCYPGSLVQAAMARLHRAPVVPDELPVWLCHTLRAMTARDPVRRPPAAAVADAFSRRAVEAVLASTAAMDAAELSTGAPPGTATSAIVGSSARIGSRRIPRPSWIVGGGRRPIALAFGGGALTTAAAVAILALFLALWPFGGSGLEVTDLRSRSIPTTTTAAVERGPTASVSIDPSITPTPTKQPAPPPATDVHGADEATEPAEVSDDNSGRSNGDGRGSGKGNGNEG